MCNSQNMADKNAHVHFFVYLYLRYVQNMREKGYAYQTNINHLTVNTLLKILYSKMFFYDVQKQFHDKVEPFILYYRHRTLPRCKPKSLMLITSHRAHHIIYI